MARKLQESGKIKVAVVTGGHPFDVPGFRDMFNRMPQLDVYIQDLDNWAMGRHDGTMFDAYDVFLFYNMHARNSLLSVRKDMDKRIADTLAQLGEGGQGIFVSHHALLAFADMQVWSDVCNLQDRKLQACNAGARVRTCIADREHPITRGLNDWEMVDEIYLMGLPGDASQVLLTTDHPQSMHVLGWAHQYKNARVFCYASGHDNETYIDPTFQTVVARGLEWLARRI